jgi:biopolymer transport protein ExbD
MGLACAFMPGCSEAPKPPAPNPDVVIRISNSNTIQLQNQLVDKSVLSDKLLAIPGIHEKSRIIISTDETVHYSEIVDVIRILGNCHLTNTTFKVIVDKDKDKGASADRAKQK